MINLIPPAARKSVAREYWLRVISVWLFLFGTACLIVAVLCLPTYMLIHLQTMTLDEQLSLASEKNATFEVSASALLQANVQAEILTQSASTTPFSVYLTTIETIAGTAIILQDIALAETPQGGTMKLSGTATTRQALANFRDALETHPAFAAVNLPISSLIKDQDLLFAMDVILATTTVSISTP